MNNQLENTIHRHYDQQGYLTSIDYPDCTLRHYLVRYKEFYPDTDDADSMFVLSSFEERVSVDSDRTECRILMWRKIMPGLNGEADRFIEFQLDVDLHGRRETAIAYVGRPEMAEQKEN